MKRSIMAAATLVVLGIAVLPTQWFSAPPQCPTCGKWASSSLYEDPFITSKCTCGEEWSINIVYGEPMWWWKYTTDVTVAAE